MRPFVRIAVVVGILVVFWQDAFSGELKPLAAPARESASAGGNSLIPATTGDGRFVAFISHANNLATNDDLSPWLDVFVRDRLNAETVLISVATNGLGGGNDNSIGPSISTNGLFVAFESAASNLVPGDTNGFTDVFLHDIAGGTTRLLSVGMNNARASGPSGAPLISADGRWVIFESSASNLVSGDINGVQDIFAYDSVFRTNVLVSTGPIGPFSSNGPCHSAAITPDGRFVAFVKSGTNTLFNSPAVSQGEVYVSDLDLRTTVHASADVHTNFANVAAPYACSAPTISQEGRFVVFKAAANGLPSARLYRHDLQQRVTEEISATAALQGWPHISADGRFVSYEATDGVRVWDGLTGSNRLVCSNAAGNSGVTCNLPALSADGSRTAFLVTSNSRSSVYVYDWLNDSNRLVTVTTNRLAGFANETAAPGISADGRLVFFESSDSRLVPDDANRSYDIFACDVDAEGIQLVSARHPDRPGLTGSSASSRVPGSLSADGQAASFLSFDGDLDATDTNGFSDVYVRNVSSGELRFLGNPTNSTRDPVFNADGRYVAYLAAGPSGYSVVWTPTDERVYRMDLMTGQKLLVAYPASRETSILYPQRPIAISPDGNLVAYLSRSFGSPANVYVRAISAGTTNLVSVNRNGIGGGNGASTEPQFSPDGRWLFFRSAATDLTTNNSPGLFARDLSANATVAINSRPAAPSFRQAVAISGNSEVVASLNTDGSVLLFNLHSRTSTVVFPSGFPSPIRGLSLDGSGRLLAYQASTGGTVGFKIHVHDTVTGSNELVSVRHGNDGPANRDSSFPSISHDGRFVAFASDATDLVPNDNNNLRDVFVRDRLRRVTLLASINRTVTGSGNGPSTLPVLSADGRTVLFQSFASDLVEGDFNESGDVFVLSLGGPDTDGDGLDDDWEMAYFGNLERDGTGDLDADGSSDVIEFQLGTEPTNLGSAFQVLTVYRGARTTKTILWSATPGRRYRVQFKDSVSQTAWTDAADTVTAGGTTAVWTDLASPAAHRFYRVAILP